MSVVIRCCCDRSSDPPSSSSPSDSSPSDSSFSESGPSLSDSQSSSLSSSGSASSGSNPPFDFCACGCCLWPNKFILTVSDIQFINDAGFGGTQPGILSYPTKYTLVRNPGSLTWASTELVYDVADDISDGGFDFPTNIFGVGTDGTVGGSSAVGSRFVDRDNGGATIRDRQAFVRFDTNLCAYSFTLFGVGLRQLFSQSACYPVGTTNPNTFLPLQPGPFSWTCMGGATFGAFAPRITNVSPFRTTCRLAANWWMPFGVNAEMPVASLAVA